GFKLNVASIQPARHGASVFMGGNYRSIENVLETRQLSNRFVLRSRHDLVRRPLRDWTSVFQHDDSFAKRKNLVPTVGDVDDRNTVLLVPRPEVLHDFGL